MEVNRGSTAFGNARLRSWLGSPDEAPRHSKKVPQGCDGRGDRIGGAPDNNRPGARGGLDLTFLDVGSHKTA